MRPFRFTPTTAPTNPHRTCEQAKKKGKKEKQKEKRKGPFGDAPSAAADASDEDGEEEAEAEAGAAGGGTLTGEKERGAAAGVAGGRQGDSTRLGACTATAASRGVGEAGAPARSSKAAAARVTAPAAGSMPDKGGYGAGSLSSLAGACGGVSASAYLASVLIREAGAGTASAAAGIAANAAQLEAHVQKCHALIRALVDACMSERQRKQALTDQLHNFECARHTQGGPAPRATRTLLSLPPPLSPARACVYYLLERNCADPHPLQFGRSRHPASP